MRESAKTLLTAVGLCFFTSIISIVLDVNANEENVSLGRALATSVAKGNCVACHSVPADKEIFSKSNIGPPLIAMQARYPKRYVLREKITDPTVSNENTIMPPFGKHKILTKDDIELIIDYLYSL